MFRYITLLLIFMTSQVFSNIDSLLNAVKDLPDSTKLNKIVIYASAITSTNPKASLELLKSHGYILKSIENRESRARYYFNLAFAYDYIDSLNPAMVNYYKALEILKSYNAKVGINYCLNNIGVIYRKQYNHLGALKAYRESYDFAKQQGMIRGQISTAMNITNIYLDLKDYEKMFESLNKTLELSMEYKDSSHLGLLYSNFGNYYYAKGEYLTGMHYIERGWQILKNSKDLAGQGANRNLLTKYYIKIKKFDKANRELNNTQIFADSINSQSLKNQILFNKAMYHRELGNYDSAFYYYSKASVWTKENGDIPKLKIAYEELANVSHKANKYDLAYLYMDSLYQLIDSLQTNVYIDEIARASLNLEGDFNSELVVRYREEVQTTKEENELIQQYVEKIELYLYFIAILAIILIIMISLLIYYAFKLKQSNLALRNSEKNLEELNATKDKFFSIIAHDLRGPTSGMKNILDHLDKYSEEFTDFEKSEIISELASASSSMMNLLENLLTWSRSQRGLITIEKTEFNAFEATNSTITNLRTSAIHKQIKIENIINVDNNILSDVNLFNTIMRNTINNSIKFTPKGGLIQVSARTEDDKHIFTISDNGIGMNAVTLSNLFRIDSKSINLGTNGEKGTGLGLIICKEFAEKMGGDIVVSSKPEMGTQVDFILPV